MGDQGVNLLSNLNVYTLFQEAKGNKRSQNINTGRKNVQEGQVRNAIQQEQMKNPVSYTYI